MKSFTEEDLKTMKKENIESKRTESPSGQSSSGDAELFTPECVQQDDEDKHKTTYRFVCPHVGQFRCSLTSLVFVMEGEGEVLYRVVSWDPRLFVGFDQKMTPAGPLYNIDCFNGSLSKLHLPHCEIFSEKNKDSLDVAHFTCGNVEIMKPLQVTETHVMIDIKGSEYSLCCQPEGCTVQPETEKFECDFGPNYHPTFEVFVNVETDEVRLSLLDKTEEKEVWVPRRILLTDFSVINCLYLQITSGKDADPPAQKRLTECEFVKKHRDKLIQKVLSVMIIADGLRTKDMIPDEMYSKVHAAEPRQEKTRLLLDVLNSGGAAVKAEFYRLLKKEEPHLVKELESGTSIPIKTTLDNSTTVQYAGLLHQLTMKARSTVRDIDPQNDLTFLRIRSKKHEIMVSTDKEYLLIVIQNPTE
ncbi:LRR and PYD domains-containing 3-like protein [Labeo rohita]|uniref:LRR and PYD domains-containing 3-like protein n=1 Tax=Labeo rohita TaxID=84645 RepID=A0A498MLC4_LABRO|nr:LRR and PYD domains-containing 3-like protein [Labeo rohita]